MSCLQRTQTVVVRVAEAVGGDGFKIYAVLGHIQVEAALCLAQVVEQADCAGNVAHRDILEHELVGEFDGFGQRAGVAGAVRISFLDIPEENTLHYLSGKVIKLKDPQILKQFDALDKNKENAHE